MPKKIKFKDNSPDVPNTEKIIEVTDTVEVKKEISITSLDIQISMVDQQIDKLKADKKVLVDEHQLIKTSLNI